MIWFYWLLDKEAVTHLPQTSPGDYFSWGGGGESKCVDRARLVSRGPQSVSHQNQHKIHKKMENNCDDLFSNCCRNICRDLNCSVCGWETLWVAEKRVNKHLWWCATITPPYSICNHSEKKQINKEKLYIID